MKKNVKKLLDKYRTEKSHMILDGKKLVPATLYEWGKWLQENQKKKIVKQEHIPVSRLWVSTVFLGLDHSFGYGPPLWFETMVFKNGWSEVETHRYETYEQAEKGHARMVTKYTKLAIL